jgi:hypothetical protein
METNIISFIIENIYLFLPLGIAGITITLILLFTGQKDGTEHQENLKTDNIYLVTYPINIYLLIYLFIWAMMLIMGLTSNFIIPAFIGGFLATIPIAAILFTHLKTPKIKE